MYFNIKRCFFSLTNSILLVTTLFTIFNSLFGIFTIVETANPTTSYNTPSSASSNPTSSSSSSPGRNKFCNEEGFCYEPRIYDLEGIYGTQLVAPDDIDDVDIKFYYFGKPGIKAKLMRFNSSVNSLENFSASYPTYFIIHGWREEYKDLGWMEFLKDVIHQKLGNKVNIFVVDWGSDSGNLFYPKPAANTIVVGDAIAYFIQALRLAFKVDCDKTHLIGFSLGAQASGYTGKRMQNKYNCKINSIMGLDPAGPYFRGSSGDNRLVSTDAKFVAALHSNMANIVLKGFGSPKFSGHIDIFLNGGDSQPGCQPLDLAGHVVAEGFNPLSLGRIGCSHSRAEQFYRTDFEKFTKCQPVAYQCESYSEFGRGRCASCGDDNEKCFLVGFWPNYKPKKPKDQTQGYYLDSDEKTPYCLYHHQIQMHVNPRAKAMTGTLYMDFVGKTRDVKEVRYERILRNFVPGAPHTMLFKYSEPLGKVEQIRAYFKRSIKDKLVGLIHKDPMLIDKIEFNYMSHIDPKVRESLSSHLCPENGDNRISEDSDKKTIFKVCSGRIETNINNFGNESNNNSPIGSTSNNNRSNRNTNSFLNRGSNALRGFRLI